MQNAVLQLFFRHWARACLPLAFIGVAGIGLHDSYADVSFWIWIHVPLFLLHQFEQHAWGSFREFVNHKLFKVPGGLYPLTEKSIFWINVPLFWGVLPLVAYKAQSAPAWGLFLPWFATISSLALIISALWRHSYIPGLVLGVLQLALSAISLTVLNALPGVYGGDNSTAILATLLVHGAIILYLLYAYGKMKLAGGKK